MKQSVSWSLLALSIWVISAIPVQAQDFSGTYFGAHFGYRWVDTDLTSPPYVVDFVAIPPRAESFNTDGVIVGVHLGHMAKLSPNWYLGLEGDIAAGWGSDHKQASFSDIYDEGGFTGRSGLKANWQGTIRARLGYASGQWMVYATGGFAFMDIDWSDSLTPNFGSTYTAQKSDLLTGWVLGGGFEIMLDPKWTLRTEYLYEDFGSTSVPLAGTTERGSIDVTAHKLRIGVSYKFLGP